MKIAELLLLTPSSSLREHPDLSSDCSHSHNVSIVAHTRHRRPFLTITVYKLAD